MSSGSSGLVGAGPDAPGPRDAVVAEETPPPRWGAQGGGASTFEAEADRDSSLSSARFRPASWAAPTQPAKELGEVNEFDGAATAKVAIPFQRGGEVEEGGAVTIEDVLLQFCTILRAAQLRYDRIPVRLNVYNIHKGNKYLRPIGLGIYHSAVELFGYEVAFGGHDESMTGVCVSIPSTHDGEMTLRERVVVGQTTKLPGEIADVLQEVSQEWPGNSYDLFTHNCNHFTDCLCRRLCGVGIPKYVNRIARAGAFFAGGRGAKSADGQHGKRSGGVGAQVSQAAHGDLPAARGGGQAQGSLSCKSGSTARPFAGSPAGAAAGAAPPEAPDPEFPPEMFFDDWDDSAGEGAASSAAEAAAEDLGDTKVLTAETAGSGMDRGIGLADRPQGDQAGPSPPPTPGEADTTSEPGQPVLSTLPGQDSCHDEAPTV